MKVQTALIFAYNEPIPIKYYKQNDFEFLFITEDQEKEYKSLMCENQLKPLLMYFDLIVFSAYLPENFRHLEVSKY
jgi:hypothetical protein